MAGDVLEEKVKTPGEPWDMTFQGWQADILDPGNFVIPLFGGKSVTGVWPGVNLSRLDDPSANREIMAARRLSREKRWRAFVDLDAEIVRDYAPEAPFSSGSYNQETKYGLQPCSSGPSCLTSSPARLCPSSPSRR